MWYSVPFTLFCMASVVQGLNYRALTNQPCFNVSKPETPVLDPKWILSLEKIYYPVMSNIHLYRVAVDLLQKEPKDVGLSTVYYDACITWHRENNGTVFLKGFNGLKRIYETTPLSDNPDAFTFAGVGGNQEYAGTLYTLLTDNKTFFFAAICLSDGEMSWGVGSTTPTLTEETRKLTLDYATNLGFHTEDFTELKYVACNN
ncbi:unnamed protein product [Orchesella dallaii]|uniref:Uncharacterized protein n=1 Tax=Orchesella dallaii TaxID=48710 RepID=A0ABP1SAG6_9HEXA